MSISILSSCCVVLRAPLAETISWNDEIENFSARAVSLERNDRAVVPYRDAVLALHAMLGDDAKCGLIYKTCLAWRAHENAVCLPLANGGRVVVRHTRNQHKAEMLLVQIEKWNRVAHPWSECRVLVAQLELDGA